MNGEKFSPIEGDDERKKLDQAKAQFLHLSESDREKLIATYHDYLRQESMPENTLKLIREFLPWAEGQEYKINLDVEPPVDPDSN